MCENEISEERVEEIATRLGCLDDEGVLCSETSLPRYACVHRLARLALRLRAERDEAMARSRILDERAHALVADGNETVRLMPESSARASAAEAEVERLTAPDAYRDAALALAEAADAKDEYDKVSDWISRGAYNHHGEDIWELVRVAREGLLGARSWFDDALARFRYVRERITSLRTSSTKGSGVAREDIHPSRRARSEDDGNIIV